MAYSFENLNEFKKRLINLIKVNFKFKNNFAVERFYQIYKDYGGQLKLETILKK